LAWALEAQLIRVTSQPLSRRIWACFSTTLVPPEISSLGSANQTFLARRSVMNSASGRQLVMVVCCARACF